MVATSLTFLLLLLLHLASPAPAPTAEVKEVHSPALGEVVQVCKTHNFPLLPILSGGAASNAGWKQRRDKASRSSPRQDHVCRAKGKSRCHFHTDVILIQALDEKEKPGGGKKGGAAAANINLASFTGVLSPLHLVPHDDEKGG